MALRKAPAAPTAKRPVRKPPAAAQPALVRSASSDPGRLLREAAWSRMFGRIESKNPFTR